VRTLLYEAANVAGAGYVTTRSLLDPDEALRRLETRLGPLHAQLRLDIEREHEAGFWSGAQLVAPRELAPDAGDDRDSASRDGNLIPEQHPAANRTLEADALARLLGGRPRD
jgi:hypothetical protein